MVEVARGTVTAAPRLHDRGEQMAMSDALEARMNGSRAPHGRFAARMTRRDWMATLGGAAVATAASRLPAAIADEPVLHVALPVGDAPQRQPGGGMVTGFRSFGWKSFAVGEPGAAATVLPGVGSAAPPVPERALCRLRLTNAIDVRDNYAIEVTTSAGQVVGRFDVRYAGLYQVQEIPLSVDQARAVLTDGALLRMVSGPGPLWFFAPSPAAAPGPDVVQLPHVLIASPGRAEAEFERRLRGLVMLQGFGWQSGCVSEGLLDLAEARSSRPLLDAVDRYLAMYFTADGVEFESPRSQPMRNRVGGIEEPLPWATLARRKPDHPALNIAVGFLPERTDSAPVIAAGGALTTEGCYTAAYPAAVLARATGRDALAALALRQLEARRQTNVYQGDIYQRASAGGQRRLRNWCRGVCWYWLGMVRALEALDDDAALAAWRPEIERVAAMLIKYQRADGLWGNFLHDPTIAADTSGSAGLAAALARAHKAGWLDESAAQAAGRALSALAAHLTPDGLLGGAAQSNKGGNNLQETDYRVIYQMAMGLKAQLMAALGA